MCDASHSATVSGVPETRISPPPLPPSGPEVDNPVSGFDHVEIVLNHHNGVALIAQFMQYVEQLLNIGEVQTGGRLVENIQRLPGAAF